MKRLGCLLVLVVAMGILVAHASAWEFSMRGEWEWRFRYLGRLGTDKDLFGMMHLQDHGGPLVGFAGPNIYGRGVGSNTPAVNAGAVRIVRGGYSASDSDAHYRDQRVTFRPHLRVNPAIDFHSRFTIGGYRNKFDQTASGVGIPPLERYYQERTSMNGYDTAGLISMETWKAVIRMPWGTLSVGIKDFPVGIGATLAENTRASSLLLVIPYGSMKIMPALWLGRGRFTDGWDTAPDDAEKRSFYGAFFYDYACGPIVVGGGAFWSLYHGNALESSTPMLNHASNAPFDEYLEIYFEFVRFFNGRFFFNGEIATLNIDRRFVGTYPRNLIGRHYFTEFGAMAGPTKLTFMGAWTTGNVLNDDNVTKTELPFAINYQALAAYEWLMFRTYAGGNHGGWTATSLPLTSDENGQLAGSYAFAVRADYAVAANLNLWASYIWAHRTEKNETLAGSTASDGSVGTTTVTEAQAWKTLNGFGPNPNPYTDDGFVGWEVNAGMDWKWLDSMTLSLRWAYWQPGEWFDQAYQAVTVRGGGVVTDGLMVGRDPINAFEGKILVEF